MNIFKTYTGNAMLNNAIMIALCLAKKKSITDLTPQVIKDLLKSKDLTSDNKRFKSYTMLFTRNGPLFNDELGDMLYEGLLQKIASSIELDGHLQCDISGLRFSRTFEEMFKEMLMESGYADAKYRMLDEKARLKKGYQAKTPEQEKKEKLRIIEEKDLSINRMWFPLIGGLGSDAQALPQAKFNYTIHPLCVLLMQFMPYGAVLYKGGVLLVDSCNYEFAFEYIQKNVSNVQRAMDITPTISPIENIKPDTSHYIIQALDLIKGKVRFHEAYTDLNLWSFSNSGTGASCTIERLPSQTLKDLALLYENDKTEKELHTLLQSKYGSNFVEFITDRIDYYGLYPTKGWDGVNIDFYDMYQEIIGNTAKISHAKYIASLINEYDKLPKGFDKLIVKTDAYKDKDYRSVVMKVLVHASENNQWSISNHLAILDNVDKLPLSSNIYQLYKMVHYYLQKSIKNQSQPQVGLKSSVASNVLGFFVDCINNGEKNYKAAFINEDNSRTGKLKRVLINRSKDMELDLALSILYDEDDVKGYKGSPWGIFDLLRIYYSNPNNQNQLSYDLSTLSLKNWDYAPVIAFCNKYFTYYCDKYKSEEKLPLEKFKQHVLKPMPTWQADFYKWFEARKEKMDESGVRTDDCDYIGVNGENQLDISLFVVTFELTKKYFTNI